MPANSNLAMVDSTPNVPTDGIEILVQLARTGKIDPWDVDIVEVTDQFLHALSELKAQDLKLTGKTLLYAAILLRMKSDSLSGMSFLDSPQEENDIEEDTDFLELGLTSAPLPLDQFTLSIPLLDRVLQRRTSVKQPRQRKVTLTDLIGELRKYEAMEKQRRLKASLESTERRRMNNFSTLSSDDIVAMAHDEFIEDTVFRLKALLEQLFEHNRPITLSELEEECKLDRVSAFIALLFLSARGEVDLHQDTFYGELYVQPDTSSDEGIPTPPPGGPVETVVVDDAVEDRHETGLELAG